MSKPRAGSAQQPKSIQEWMENELERDTELRREVEETLNRMRIEQDLATLRERRNMSQYQLAQVLGITQPAVAKLEAGKVKNLELRTIVRYVTALGARVRVLIEEEDKRQAPAESVLPLGQFPLRCQLIVGHKAVFNFLVELRIEGKPERGPPLVIGFVVPRLTEPERKNLFHFRHAVPPMLLTLPRLSGAKPRCMTLAPPT